jgi:hypothetical protein
MRQQRAQEAEYRDGVGACGGGAEGDRTPDLLIAKWEAIGGARRLRTAERIFR